MARHDARDDACMKLSQDDLEMGRCPRGSMCDCYWCPHCDEPHAGFIGCAPAVVSGDKHADASDDNA